MRRSARVAAAVTAVVVATLVLAPQASAEDYPTWDQVQAAKASQAATQAEVERINGFITELTAESARLGKITIEKAAASAEAAAALDAATKRSDRLTAAAAKAAETSDAARARYGGIVSQLLVSSGSQDLTLRLFLDHGDSRDLLYRLGAMTKLTEQAAALESTAEQSSNQAASLRGQAEVARSERDTLAQAAATALAEARAAEKEASDQLAAQLAASRTLYAQLATLTSEAADVQRRYDAGEAAREAAERAADTGSGGGSLQTGDVVVDPAAAKAYARGAIGAYGWGDEQFTCLVLLWNRESGWRANAYNPDGGAYGIPQSLPAEKMATAGPDWRTNAATQINWGLSYISRAYGSPCAAWAHSEQYNWY